jgi:sec-independent protein translocase protein TatA
VNLALIPLLPQVGPTELIIILTIVLLLFGAKKIPELAKGLGTGIREFKKGTSGADEKDEVDERKREEALTGAASDGNAGIPEEAAREEHAAAERAEQQR